MHNNNEKNFTSKQVDDCIELLSYLLDNPEFFMRMPTQKRIDIMKFAGLISRPNCEQIRKQNKAVRKIKKQNATIAEKKARAATGIRLARENAIFSAPLQIADDQKNSNITLYLQSPRNCYICKKEFTELHFFYDTMCPKCAELNYQKRFQTADLTGQIALITGSRLKIGYHSTLMLLRSGAEVIATTRFPKDSALRYAKEKDFKDWSHRLHIYGLDLRHTPSVEIFCHHINASFKRLDILINNAAQTVRRPPAFYAHLMENETKLIHEFPENIQLLLQNYKSCTDDCSNILVNSADENKDLPVTWNTNLPGIGLRDSAKLSQIPYNYDNTLPAEKIFPKGKLDVDLQQVDLRTVNSWRLKLGEIQTAEMIEIQLINSIAPFVLCNKLSPLMKKDYTGKKHIVNVSAMEGKFLRFKKGERHPHTNMAKAALNMLTHTSASELRSHGIYMNAVDTGWVTDEDPVQLSQLKQELHDFQPPLDIVDGAARVCDPIFDGINTGKHWCGKFLKDYFPIDW